MLRRLELSEEKSCRIQKDGGTVTDTSRLDREQPSAIASCCKKRHRYDEEHHQTKCKHPAVLRAFEAQYGGMCAHRLILSTRVGIANDRSKCRHDKRNEEDLEDCSNGVEKLNPNLDVSDGPLFRSDDGIDKDCTHWCNCQLCGTGGQWSGTHETTNLKRSGIETQQWKKAHDCS